jgi:outer membrane protein assembly factor BamB
MYGAVNHEAHEGHEDTARRLWRLTALVHSESASRRALTRPALFFVSCFVLFVSFVIHPSVQAENWPQWRGPQLNGISTETNLPVKWSPTENVAWKVAVPQYSGSTPIIWGEHIFLSVADKGSLHLWALDRHTGATRWSKLLSGGDRRQMKQNMSSPSPVTDGRHVWIMTGTGMLTAFDFAGTQVWQRDIQKDYGNFGIMHGYAASPLLYEDALYVPVLHGMMTDDPSYILKIEKTTGKTIWRQERPTRARFESPDAYTTPALLKHAGGTEIVITGGDVVTGHDPGTGQELWRADGLNPYDEGNYRIVASPVVHGELLFAPSRERPLLSIRPGGKGDITKSHVLWSFNNGPDVPTPVTDGTYLYSINDRGIMYVLEAGTGKTVYGPQRLRSATYSASPVLADGKVYITDEDGVTSVVAAGPKFELLAENDLGQYTLSSVAISEGQLFLRTDGFLFAVGQRRK